MTGGNELWFEQDDSLPEVVKCIYRAMFTGMLEKENDEEEQEKK